MKNVKNRTKHDLQNKLTFTDLQYAKIPNKFLRAKSSNLGTKSLKVRARPTNISHE